MPRPNPPPSRLLTRRRRVGEQIRAARLQAGLTQQQVCEHTGLDRTGYGRIELGHSSPTLDTLFLIADAIGVELVELVRPPHAQSEL
ncbi:helix-turn-helix domain-containing protein [Streptomyces albipurpureus]|uniref:Helix-turn-helix domain-containing protein n=1 Tax=Streptomyces albipurpureus TaxID=2897419 RepID=A0ABT0V1P5_9ACTN|nr:helix-turn-helix transcriptional regulator [Streptomyces sp. CWNU-1]MCM2394446.1 helix-turn-helix domain-containing protein [Streptomyces sp. CWNU-1]